MNDTIAQSPQFGNLPLEWLCAGGGFVFGALVVALFFLWDRQKMGFENAALKAQIFAEKDALKAAGEVLDQRFKVTAQEALTLSGAHFLQLAQEKLGAAQKDQSHELEKRQKAIDDLVRPVQEHLKALSGALEQVKGTDEALRHDLKHLSLETAKLVGALRDPSAQGVWGEFILEGLLDKSGLIKGVHYDTQVNMVSEQGRQRPDAVIHMNDGFKIVVDAKAPLNQFAQRLGETMSEADHSVLMQNLARQVREHIKILGKKGYWEHIESPDFTVMFLPSEHMYSVALRADPSLVEFAADRNVILASPTLFMSLLRVVSVSWRQVDLAKNAQEISERGIDLYKRLLKFTDHIGKIGGHLQGAMKGYNEAVGSLERSVLPAARRFKDLQTLSSEKELPDLSIETEAPRLLALGAEDEQEKKRA